MHDWWPDTWEKLPASAPPPQPSMTKNSSSSRPPTAKTGAQLRKTGGARKMAQNAPKTLTAIMISKTESEAPPTVCMNLSLQDHGNVQTLSMNCSGNIDHPVRVLQLRNVHSFLHCETQQPVIAQRRACPTDPRTAPLANLRSSAQLCTVRTCLCEAAEISTTRSMNGI